MAVGVDGMARSIDGVSLNAPTEISADWWQEQGPNSRGGSGLNHHSPRYIEGPSLIHWRIDWRDATCGYHYTFLITAKFEMCW